MIRSVGVVVTGGGRGGGVGGGNGEGSGEGAETEFRSSVISLLCSFVILS